MTRLCAIRMLYALWTFSAAALVLAASPVWQPLCPSGGTCASASAVPIEDGRALIDFNDSTGRARRQWVALDTFAGAESGFVCTSVKLPASRCAAGGATGGAVFDATGSVLYTFNPSGLEGMELAASNYELLSPTILFDKTVPPTLVSGFNTGGGGTRLFLSQDEGRTWEMQRSNLTLWNLYLDPTHSRTNFIASPDGNRLWVNPGPVSPGLWQPPALADSGGHLDFTRLTRVDDGSYPSDVFQLRTLASSAALPGGYAVALARNGMYVSIDQGVSWRHSTFAAAADDFVFADASSGTTQVIASRESVWVSRDVGQTWTALAHGLPAGLYTLSADHGMLVANGPGLFACRGLDCDGPGFGKVVIDLYFGQVTEFYHPGLDHYFITADQGEKFFVRSGGAGAGWTETGQSFWAWTLQWPLSSAIVCRFYGDPALGPNSHFYSASTDECRGLLKRETLAPDGLPRWHSEGYAFKVALPASFRCSGGTLPVWRVYNNGYTRGIDSNHRYVLDTALIQPLQARGWISEGIVFCVPAGPM